MKNKKKIGLRINKLLLAELLSILERKECLELKHTTQTEAFEEGLRIYIGREKIKLDALSF
jgi:hypothetical protein